MGYDHHCRHSFSTNDIQAFPPTSVSSNPAVFADNIDSTMKSNGILGSAKLPFPFEAGETDSRTSEHETAHQACLPLTGRGHDCLACLCHRQARPRNIGTPPGLSFSKIKD